MKALHLIYCLSAVAVHIGCAFTMAAQDRYDRVERITPVARGSNAAYLIKTDISHPLFNGEKSLKDIHIDETFISGGLFGYSGSDLSYDQRFTLRGEEHLKGLSISGKAYMNNSYDPHYTGSLFSRNQPFLLDIVGTEQGRRSGKSGGLQGSVAKTIGKNLTLGVSATYDAFSSRNAKSFDGYSSGAMDASISPAILFSEGMFSVGANAYFKKSGDRLYYANGDPTSVTTLFLDKGMMYGRFNSWDGLMQRGLSGNTCFYRTWSGGAVQLSAGNVFLEAQYLLNGGKSGDEDYHCYRFPGKDLHLGAIWAFGGKAKSGWRNHIFRIGYDWSRDATWEAVIEDRISGGQLQAITYSYLKLYDIRETLYSFRYETLSDSFDIAFNAEANPILRRCTAVYPVLKSDIWTLGRGDLSFTSHLGALDLSARVFGSTSIGKVKSSEDAAGGTSYQYAEAYLLQREKELATSAGGGLGLVYTFDNQANGEYYIELDASLLYGLDLKYAKGPYRFEGGLKIGLCF